MSPGVQRELTRLTNEQKRLQELIEHLEERLAVVEDRPRPGRPKKEANAEIN